MGNNQGSERIGNLMSLAANWLKKGSIDQASTRPSARAIVLIKIDSVRNCFTRLAFNEPNTLRTPTSLARLADRAVDRFIKFTQAISKMKNAMAENIYTY